MPSSRPQHIATAAMYDDQGRKVGTKYLFTKTEIQEYCDRLARKRLPVCLRYTRANERGIKGY
jgi:hypothetical protein